MVKEFSWDNISKFHNRSNQLFVGLTGGIGSGKTTVANIFQEMGALTIDFDIIAHKVMETGTKCFKNIIDYFGTQILDFHGNINRKKLSKLVFNNIKKRKKLEQLTHPFIYENFFNHLKKISNNNPNSIVQVVIPLLIEFNLMSFFDKIIIVYVPCDIQNQRVIIRDNITKQETENILKSQMPIEEKLQFADFIIDNTKDLVRTKNQAENIWNHLINASLEKINKTK